MAYERIDRPKGLLYHYTKRENIEPILQDGRIRKFKDRECHDKRMNVFLNHAYALSSKIIKT